MPEQINISELPIGKLKEMAYDFIVEKDMVSNNLYLVQQEIRKRNTAPPMPQPLQAVLPEGNHIEQ